jgi:integrase/recombinase XerD
MANVKIVLRKDKMNKDKIAPIHFRITKNRKSNYIASTLLIPVKDWDEKHSKIKKSYSNSARLNSFLTHKFAELQDKVIEQETMHKGLVTRQLKQYIYGREPLRFFPFAEAACQAYLGNNQAGTYSKSRSILKKIEKYAGNNNIFFQDITLEFLQGYEAYWQKESNNKTNTIRKDMAFISKMFNDAYRQDKIDHGLIPFNSYKLKSEKSSRTFLTTDEQKAFEDQAITPGSRQDLHKDMFIFASYSGGLRILDVLKLKWENFDGSHVSILIHKTKTLLSVMLPERALDILAKYRPKKVNPRHFIFPELSNDLDLEDAFALKNALSNSTKHINASIRAIAKSAKISKPVSFHVSRHTWATRALQKGISIDKVSKILGHADISETQIYAKIVNEELDKAMLAFNEEPPKPKRRTKTGS